MRRVPSPTFALLAALAFAPPALAFSPDDPGPTLGGAVAGGTAHSADGSRIDMRLQLWLPPSVAAPAPLRLGIEGSFGIEGDTTTADCPADAGFTGPAPDQASSAASTCVEAAVGARLLIGAEWGEALVGRVEGGLGAAWRRALDGHGTHPPSQTRWSLSWVGRAVGLAAVGEMLGGAWRIGLSFEGSGYGTDRLALGAGLVFEATVID